MLKLKSAGLREGNIQEKKRDKRPFVWLHCIFFYLPHIYFICYILICLVNYTK